MSPQKKLLVPILVLLLILTSAESYAQVQDVLREDSLEQYRIVQIEKYSKRLHSLRTELKVALNSYVSEFALKKLDKTSLDQLTKLRGDLKSQVAAMIDNGTNGEAVVAANRAKIDLLTNEINTIEKLFGEPKGAYTNEFNLFNTEELKLFSEKIKPQAAELEKSVAKFSKSEVPTDLLQRKNELLTRLNEVQKELQLRQSTAYEPKLKAIDKSIKIEYLKANEHSLEQFNGANKEKLYAKQLKRQVELRLHSSPRDASLLTLKNNLPGEIVKDNLVPSISARPPPSTWKNPITDVVAEIRNAVFAEQTAIELRDPLNIAKARTNSIIYQNWLKVGLPGLELNSSYDLLSINDLKVIKSRNTRWLVNLNKEFAVSSKTMTALEIQEAKTRIFNIEKSIQQRLNSFPYEPPSLKSQLTRGPPLEAFESRLSFFEKHIETRELRVLIDKPVHITDLKLKTAYEKNVKRLKTLEGDALTYGKGKQGARVINDLIKAQKSVLENQSAFLNDTKGSFIQEVLTKTKTQLATLKTKVNKLKFSGKRIVYNQSPTIPSIKNSPFTAKKSLKVVPKKAYPVEYKKSFPKNKSWTKSLKGLIKDIKKAPGGVIIDGKLESDFVQEIEKVEFDIFTNEIKVLRDGKWKTVGVSKDWTILRQAWAYVNDGRVAAVDLRSFSSQETRWYLDYIIKNPKSSLTKMESIKKLIPKITTVNLHPAFQNTFLGDDLILADQIIFDLLPTEHTRIEGQYKHFRELGLDVDGLRKVYLQDFRKRNAPGIPPRSITKSIISVQSVGLNEKEEKIHLQARLDFAIYLIPNRKSDVSYIKMENSSNWFNQNRGLLSSKISYLKKLEDLAAVIAFFNAVQKNTIENNFYELVYLVVEEEQTPKYLFSSEKGFSYDEVVDFLEGKLE